MNFIILDKNEFEMNIITDFLTSENVKFKIKKIYTPTYIVPDAEEDIDFVETYEVSYDIMLNCSLEYFDYIKKKTKERIELIKTLNKCYRKKSAIRKKKKTK